MRLDASDLADLRPLIDTIVASTVSQFGAASAHLDADRLGFLEGEAAAKLGIKQHVLRDARLRGEIIARRVGRQYVYGRGELIAWLSSNPRK